MLVCQYSNTVLSSFFKGLASTTIQSLWHRASKILFTYTFQPVNMCGLLAGFSFLVLNIMDLYYIFVTRQNSEIQMQ